MKNLIKKVIVNLTHYTKINFSKFKEGLGERGFKKFKNASFYLLIVTIVGTSTNVLATDDPLTVVNNLSDFIFSLIRAIGAIICGFSIVQVGMSFKSHDPSQRANGFLSAGGGIIIFFAKEILGIITGG